MSNEKPKSMEEIVESTVNCTKKLSELPKTAKEIILAGIAGLALYGATHINAAEAAEANYWTSPEVSIRSATYQTAPQQPATISVTPNTQQKTNQNNLSSATTPRVQRNLLSPVTRQGITSGTIDYIVEDNGNVILDESQLYLISEKNPTERWVPFLENGKIKGHYVGTDDDLTIRLNGRQGIYADQEHQVLRSEEGNSTNGLYALGIFAALAAGYGISRLPKKKTSEETKGTNSEKETK